MLYIVATPIGNLDDITFRAVKVLKSVDIILAEDTRHSKNLLKHYSINTLTYSFHEFNEKQKTAQIIDKLKKGKNIALISDAGTPLINDPGYILVKEAKKSNIKVVPIPGASAVISALSASGLASDSFSFFGFLPTKQAKRLKTIQTISSLEQTTIFYESPKRILASLLDMLTILGDKRIVCLAKELTKSFETIKTATLPELIEYLQIDKAYQKGEFVVLISGVDKGDKIKNEEQIDKILPILLSEMSAAKAAKITAKITNVDKKYCYQKAIKL